MNNDFDKKKIYVIITGVIAFVFVTISFYFMFFKDLFTVEKYDNEEVQEEIVEEKEEVEEYEDLNTYVEDIAFYNTPKKLVSLVQVPSYGKIDDVIYVNGGAYTEYMTVDYKFTLASNLIINIGETINESDMKLAYESLFGIGTYKMVPKVMIGCMLYTYDSSNKIYIADSNGCGGESSLTVYNDVINTYIENGVYNIVTSVLYYNNGSYYKDAGFLNVLNVGNNDLGLYMRTYSNMLEQYTYKFVLEEDHYIYKGVVRTNNYK